MSISLFILGAGLFVIWFYRMKRKSRLHDQFRYDLMGLREELRWRCINGEVSRDSWAFDYIDQSIDVAVKNLRYINAYSAIGLRWLHRKDRRIDKFAASLDTEMGKPGNGVLHYIDSKFGELMVKYVIRKHTLLNISLIVFFLPKLRRAAKEMKTKQKSCVQQRDLIQDFRLYPETSASGDFARAI